VTVHVVAVVVEQVRYSGVDVTVYPVMGVPPTFLGAVQNTTDWASAPDVATTPVGCFGTASGVVETDSDDASELPEPLVATTRKV